MTRGRRARYVRDPKDGEPVIGLYERKRGDRYDYYHYDDNGRERRCGNSRDPHGAIAEFRRRDAQRKVEFVTLEVASPVAHPQFVKPDLIEDKLHGRKFWSYSIPVEAFAAALRDIAIQPDGPETLAKLTGLPAFRTLHTAPMPEKSVTFDEIRANYEETKSFDDADEMTRSLGMWDEFVVTIGRPETLADVSNADLARYFEFIAREYAAKTRKNRIGKVNGILNHAAAHLKEHRAAIGDFKIEMRTVKQTVKGTTGKALKDKPNPMPIQPAEFRKLLNVASKKWKALLHCALNMGLHPSEAGMLTVDDFDFDVRTYRSERTKTGEWRAAILWKRTIKAIRDYMKSDEYRESDGGYLFLNEDQGNETPMTRWNVNDGMKTLRKRAKIRKDKLTFDSLRDATETCGSIGNDSGAVDILMAHALSTTNASPSYRYRLPEHTANVVATLEARFFPPK